MSRGETTRIADLCNPVWQLRQVDDKEPVCCIFCRNIGIRVPAIVRGVPELVNLHVAPDRRLTIDKAEFARILGIGHVEYGCAGAVTDNHVFAIRVEVHEAPNVSCAAIGCVVGDMRQQIDVVARIDTCETTDTRRRSCGNSTASNSGAGHYKVQDKSKHSANRKRKEVPIITGHILIGLRGMHIL